ncbi:MAG TPA: pro-sigmaK processing inhibitor BofA family protein [Candidatus Norongarragalinales archaeon]|nr:pro-sigmaK processing inhibitor BofA family protein [Candidatus Norongarragalinales archaeon]
MATQDAAAVAAVGAIAFPWEALLLAVALIVLAFVIWKILKNILINTVLGVVILLGLNLLADFLHYPVLKIPITFVTVVVSAVLGVAGVGLLIILKLLGIVIA